MQVRGSKKASATMLAVKRSAGVAPKMNVRTSVHTDEKACKQGDTLALTPGADVTKSPNQWPHEKDLCPLKMF